MAAFLFQTLIRTSASSACLFSAAKPKAIRCLFSAAKPKSIRCLCTLPETSSSAEVTASEAEAKAVDKIEDVIHGIIVKRSKPDWLPFVPGASYWVPPRRRSYGVAEVVNQLVNAHTDEEYLSVVSLQGWPSSAFYIHNDTFSQLDLAGGETTSTSNTALPDEDC